MKQLYFIITVLLIIGCTNKKNVINYPSESIKLYTEILDTLITNNFYHLYLGSEYGDLLTDYNDQKIDSIEVEKNIRRLKEKYKNEKKEKCIIVIRNEITSKDDVGIYSLLILKKYFYKDINDTTQFPIISEYLITPSNLKPSDLNFIDFIEFKSFDKEKEKNFGVGRGIGTIAVSKIYFVPNKDMALLYYEFHCGGKCGQGEILLLNKLDNRWVIKEKAMIWES